MDASDFSTYPLVVNTEYSPTKESCSYPNTLDKAYLADLYATSPDQSFDTFIGCESIFDRPVNSVEFPAGFNDAANSSPNTRINLNAYQPAFNPVPFSQLEQGFAPSFPFDIPSSFEPDMATSPRNTESNSTKIPSLTPSLCGDGPSTLLASPRLSATSLKRESPDEPTSIGEEPRPKRPERKRGRPRLDRRASDTPSASSTYSSSQNHRTNRLPHNQVERKYREGLNSELERLRRAVPTLPQSDESASMGQPKPSKAMVLAGAIEYIRSIERERDELREENERLGGKAWRNTKNRRQDSVATFLVEE